MLKDGLVDSTPVACNCQEFPAKQPFVNGFPQLRAMEEGPLVDEMHDQEVKPQDFVQICCSVAVETSCHLPMIGLKFQ